MRTKIISAFPGTGKSYFHRNNKTTTLDSDSSKFSWIIADEKIIRSPFFPNNYIKHVKENIGKYEYIFVSTHKEVIEALLDNCIFFYVIFPQELQKEQYMERYKNRGNDDDFIVLLNANWRNWLSDLKKYRYITDGCKFHEMKYKEQMLEIELEMMFAKKEID